MPRVAYDGGKLANARDLSSLLLPDIDVRDHKLTSMTMSFGQFIIHDITRTLPTSNDIKCCPTKKAVHPECMAINIRRMDDVLLKHFNQTCINFVRSIVCNPCSLGKLFFFGFSHGLKLDSWFSRSKRATESGDTHLWHVTHVRSSSQWFASITNDAWWKAAKFFHEHLSKRGAASENGQRRSWLQCTA